MQLEFKIAASQFRGEFSTEEIRIRTGDKNTVFIFFSKAIDHFFKIFDILNLVDEEIFCPCCNRFFLNECIQLIWCFNIAVSSFVQVQVNDVFRGDSSFCELPCYRFHKAGLATSTNAGDHFDHTGIMVKATYFLQVIISLI